MNADTFISNFGHLVNAPGGVGKIRDLIYHLAFAGDLVDRSTENASDLIEKLTSTESPTGRIRRQSLESAKEYYPIPPHWRWVNIGSIGHDWGQTKPPASFTYIDVSAIDNKKGVVAEGAEVVSAANASSRARKIVKKGTVIYSTIRPYLLNVAVIEEDFEPAPIASTAFAILHPYEGVEAKYVYYYLRSPAFVNYVQGVQSGIAYPAISDQKFFAASFPLAPTEEQKRIVAKVDELMALCDRLDTQQKERERQFSVLSSACHARLA
ncbi:MAG: restriction endonuclease subunit S, partial [Prosthecobacter sp.]|nr:restriction endonuclease subunit S [Prosthecobacter sp.]